MTKLQKVLFCVFVIISLQNGNAQTVFTKGVNLSNWFQSNSVKQIPFTKYSKQDLQNIKNLGADVIRLPLNLHYMTDGAPNYTISPLFFQFLDSAVTWAEELKIYLILDNHTFDPIVKTPANFDVPLRKEWIQMAKHYKNRSNYILYEILNEPHGPTTAAWCKMQKTVIDTIRTVDTKHSIIVGAAEYNAFSELKNMTIYSDTNLIYTFHFYEPFLFTHQGASWTAPSMDSLAGIPFPYNKKTMPNCPSPLKGTWIEGTMNQYFKTGTDSSVKALLDVTLAFRNQKKVKIFCGEYGVYNIHSQDSNRVYWYNMVRNYLETNKIPWTSWDYQGGFGLFKVGSNEQFNYDLNIPLVKSLGFNEQNQQIFRLLPDSVGFPVYTDYVEKNVIDYSWADTSKLDFYNNQNPNTGKSCMLYQDSVLYRGISLKFLPEKDLSLLQSNNYALDFMVRCNNPKAQFEIRFVDNKTNDTATHSWRMSYLVTSKVVPFDNRWHHVHIPFSQMKETGAWDGTWSNPRGKFDWKSIGYLEFRNEQKALPSQTKIWFDNIIVTNLDTALVYDTTKLVEPPKTYSEIYNGNVKPLNVYPNPTKQQTTLSYQLLIDAFVAISIYNTLGQKVCTLVQAKQSAGEYAINWQTADIPQGFYVCKIETESGIDSIVILKE